MFATGVGLGAFASWWWLQLGPVAVAPGTPSPAVASVEARGAEGQAGNGDAAVLLARLDEIAARLRSLEASVQDLAVSPVRTPAVASAAGRRRSSSTSRRGSRRWRASNGTSSRRCPKANCCGARA
jgi:hypothetical protein